MNAPVASVVVRAYAKLNLCLRVGGLREDGYHELHTVFSRLSLHDEVMAEPADGLVLRLSGRYAEGLLADESNLAYRAAELLADHAGISPDAALTVHKTIPVAAGLAGGSADAAATLIACNRLWQLDVSVQELEALAAKLGSDVPFCIRGGIAVGTGRGERLESVAAEGQFHWVLVPAVGQLSTPAVYAELARLRRESGEVNPPADIAAVVAALLSGKPRRLAGVVANDLEVAAVSLRPELNLVLAAGRDVGALAALVCGSGPTCAFLARDAAHAVELVGRLGVAAAGSGVETGSPIPVASGCYL